MKNKVKNTVKIALFAAIMCVISQFSFPIPLSPVPITLSLFIVFLSGAMLSPASAFTSQIIYLLIGAVGLPVFSGFRGGLSVFFSPTGGFLIAYPFMALIISLFAKTDKKFILLFISMLISLFLCYFIGTAVYIIYSNTSFSAALSVTVLPFIPFDILKAVFTSLFSIIITKRLH